MTGSLSKAMLAAACLFSLPAAASEMSPDEARNFVVGKQFSYTCFEGTTGSGRIHADGSVAGRVRVQGQGPSRFVVLPAGPIGTKGGAVCAQVRGMPFRPCFNLQRTSHASFRGTVSGFGFACDFYRRAPGRRSRARRCGCSRFRLRLRRSGKRRPRSALRGEDHARRRGVHVELARCANAGAQPWLPGRPAVCYGLHRCRVDLRTSDKNKQIIRPSR